eukprot:NODE_863_length_3436_cov_1.124064.p2 type:complete len:307 gc:universal NODE_863_length_3436_cov_1.124064:1766-846(-)
MIFNNLLIAAPMSLAIDQIGDGSTQLFSGPGTSAFQTSQNLADERRAAATLDPSSKKNKVIDNAAKQIEQGNLAKDLKKKVAMTEKYLDYLGFVIKIEGMISRKPEHNYIWKQPESHVIQTLVRDVHGWKGYIDTKHKEYVAPKINDIHNFGLKWSKKLTNQILEQLVALEMTTEDQWEKQKVDMVINELMKEAHKATNIWYKKPEISIEKAQELRNEFEIHSENLEKISELQPFHRQRSIQNFLDTVASQPDFSKVSNFDPLSIETEKFKEIGTDHLKPGTTDRASSISKASPSAKTSAEHPIIK